MFRPRDRNRKTQEERKRREAAPSVEALDERIVPSATGTHAAAAATPQPALIARFASAVGRLEGQFRSKLEQFETLLTRRIDHLDARYQGAVEKAATKVRPGATPAVVRKAEARLVRATAVVEEQVNRFIARFDRKWDTFAHGFNHRLDQVGHRSSEADPALKPAVDAVQGNFHAAEAAFQGMFLATLQADRTALRDAVHAVHIAIGSPSTSGLSTTGSPGSGTMSTGLTTGLRSTRAANQAAFNSFVSQFNNASNALATAFATNPSGPVAASTPFTSPASSVLAFGAASRTGALTTGSGLPRPETTLGSDAGIITGTLAAPGAGGTASSPFGTAGIGTFGLQTSGFGANGVASSSFGTAGVATAGLAAAGIGANGVASSPFGTAGIGTNGIGTNGFGTIGFPATGFGTIGFPTTGFGTFGSGTAGLGTGVVTVGLGTTPFEASGVGQTSFGAIGLGTPALGIAPVGTSTLGTAGLGTPPLGAAGLGSVLTGLGIGTPSTATLGLESGMPVIA